MLAVSNEGRPTTASTPPVLSSPEANLVAAVPQAVFGHPLTKVIVTHEATGTRGWLRDLLVGLGRGRSDLTVVLAYDPGFPDLRIIAVGVRDIAADRLLAAYVSVTGRIAGDMQFESREFDGRQVVCFNLGPATPMNTCVGARDDMLLVVTSSEYVHITEAMKAIL
jgi:hypothetical protein